MGGLNSEEKQAYQNYVNDKSVVASGLSRLISNGGKVTNADLQLAQKLTGGSIPGLLEGNANVESLKQRMGDQLGNLNESLQDYKRLGKYVSPEAIPMIGQAASTLNKTLGNVVNKTDSQSIFSPNFKNVTDPTGEATPSAQGASTPTSTNISNTQKILFLQKHLQLMQAQDPTGFDKAPEYIKAKLALDKLMGK
jgi:hypothetical protein